MNTIVSLTQMARLFLRLGATSFGGSMLPLMEETVVERRNWLKAEQFSEAIALAELVPGPIALKVAAYVGYLLRGWRGAWVAVSCFTLPSLLLILLLGMTLFQNQNGLPTQKVLTLLLPVVMGLFLTTTWRLGQRCLKQPHHWLLALLTFLWVQSGGSPLLILWVAGLLGIVWNLIRQHRPWTPSSPSS